MMCTCLHMCLCGCVAICVDVWLCVHDGIPYMQNNWQSV